MSSFRLRPKFDITVDKSTEEIIQAAKTRLKLPEAPCTGIAMQDHITLRILRHERHYWSPQLSILLISDDDSSQTAIKAVYGPMPNVWTFFTLSYLAISVLAVFISIIGFSQLSLGLESQILWVLPVLAFFAMFLYLLGQFGQKLGAEQMFTLHHFFEEVIGRRIHVD
jgi:hypothetical protein